MRLCAALTQDTQHRFGVLHYAYLPDLMCPLHLAPFALRTAFPPSLAGRDSGDYYEASVAIGLAPDRRSHVRRCRTWQRDVGVPLISLNALTGHRSWPRRLRERFSTNVARLAPVSGVFPADANFHLLEIGI